MDPLIHTYARTHVHEEVGGSHQVLATLFLIYFFATGSLNEPDTIQFAKLTGRLAPGTLLFLFSQYWGQGSVLTGFF